MIQKTEITFHLDQGWGDFKNLWCIKIELGKQFNGYLKDGNMEWQEVDEGAYDISKLTPFMKVGRYFPVQELVDALTDTKKATEQVETLSELKATRYHLEDMRKLLKIK
jgi:hypothetical protein